VRRARPALARAVVADVRALPFRAGAFDGVLSTSTLDHFDDPAAIDDALAELARALGAGGRLVLTLDNAAHPLVRLRNALPAGVARRTGLVPFAVGATLDEAGARAAVARAGLDVDAGEHLLHAPHVVGTRLARFGWWERVALPRFAGLARTRAAHRTGHFVALLATRPSAGRRPGDGTA
jgi:SAM-dependent methyltransferase